MGISAEACVPLTRVTMALRAMLEELLKDPDRERYGFDLLAASGCSTGTPYQILKRLEQAGWVTGWWEDARVPRLGPRRKFYVLTDVGVREARRVLTVAPR